MSTDNWDAAKSNKNLLKSSALISAGVLTSRVLGFIRDIVLANLLGTGIIAEAFFVAQRIPNMLRDLVGEGAANAAIVPVLAEYQKTKTKQQWHLFVNVLLAWGTIILTLLTVLGIILTPWIIRFMAPGFLGKASLFNLTIELTWIMFPYLILVALTALQMGVLYTLNSFKAPAFSSCLLNIAMILSAWVATVFSWATAYILAIGVVIGGILQLLWQSQALAELGFRWSWPKRLRHEGMGKIAKLLAPRLWGSAVYQVNVFVDTLFASLAFIVGPGGIAAIYFANRLIQFPLGVFAYSLSNASLPSLSSMSAGGDYTAFKETLYFSLKNLLFVLLPCAVYLVVLAPLAIATIFQHGAFDEHSTAITSSVVQFLSLGLPFFGASRILVSGFYAMQDTATPVKIATIALLVNVILNVIFVLICKFQVGSIALASSISGIVNFVMLYMVMRAKLGKTRGILKNFLLRLFPCLIMMGAMMFLLDTFLSVKGLFKLLIVGIAGGAAFVLCCLFMQISQVRSVWKTLKRRSKISP